MDTATYSKYAVARDAATIAKFLAKIANHREKLALYTSDPERYEFPRPVGKDAKWPAYEAAGRIERTLGTPRADSVEGLAVALGAALAAVV